MHAPSLAFLALLASITGLAGVSPAKAQVQPEMLSYPIGLNPMGDNFLALRSLPSGTAGVRLARLGPETLFAEIGRVDGWAHVRLLDGTTGWVSARFVGCCRTVASGVNRAQGERPAEAERSCDDLWYDRNTIYKAAGYCFHTARAIARFGNAGCSFDSEADVPLSSRQRQQVSDLQRQEAALGCSP